MKTKLMIIVGLLLINSFNSYSQSPVGFWKVDKVMVGDRNLTPVAKWFRYRKDHTYQAGNGWTQNDIGTWIYNKKKKEFLPESGRNGADEYGPFKVSFSSGNMTWERMEDGMKVVVNLSLTAEMPMAPKDSLSGMWELVTDNATKETLFISWGGNFRKTKTDGSQSFGYWHMDPHHSEFHMIDYNREIPVSVLIVSFKDNRVIMKPKAGGEILTYRKK
ncbi:MAG: hypothetical protein ACFHWX_16465 [Bacteroidota bacterium]